MKRHGGQAAPQRRVAARRHSDCPQDRPQSVAAVRVRLRRLLYRRLRRRLGRRPADQPAVAGSVEDIEGEPELLELAGRCRKVQL